MAAKISPEVANNLGCIDCRFFNPTLGWGRGGRCSNPDVVAATEGFDLIPLTPEGDCINKLPPYADILANAFAVWLEEWSKNFSGPKSK